MNRYRFLTFNLRLDLEVDGINRWNLRKPAVFSFLNKQKYDIVGFQEVTPQMYEQLKSELNDYEYVGTYRYYLDEANPIFFKKDKFECLEYYTFWLTDTPKEPSILENSFFYRICTYAVLEAKNETIIFMNTHLDYHSDDLSLKQLMYVLEKIESLKEKYQNAKVVLVGDFNQTPDTRTIQYASEKMKKTYDQNQVSYHAYGQAKPGVLLDYIFIQNIAL
jgi:endonuclease/exonuclease/phosphatase family metal-dependent hydrolase